MSILSKFKKGFQRGANALQVAFSVATGRGVLNADELFAIEEALYQSDFGVETTEEILEAIRESNKRGREYHGQDATKIARAVLRGILADSEGVFPSQNIEEPEVLCLLGVNGSGKTTTCAKLGHLLKESERSLLLGACDTFRAAATEQLKTWANRLNLDVVTGHHGADPAAVAFDAYSAAVSRKCDYVIVDTAGRLHVKEGLMEELVKMKRVLAKRSDKAPHHSWLVLDGSTGNNGLQQARVFHEKFGLTGIVVTKLDGTSKGGMIVSIFRELKLPIYFVGLGESADDLQPFSVENYLDSILPSFTMESTL